MNFCLVPQRAKRRRMWMTRTASRRQVFPRLVESGMCPEDVGAGSAAEGGGADWLDSERRGEESYPAGRVTDMRRN